MSNKMTVKDRLKTYRKHPGSFLVMLLVMLGALLTFSVLLFLIAYILINGVPHIKLSLFEWNYTSENASVVPALINTIVMTILSLLIAVPFGIFSAIFLVEYSPMQVLFNVLFDISSLDGSTFYSHSPFDLKYNIHRHHPPPDFHIPLLVT